VAALVEVFREARRVLRDDGTLWLNLGDSYKGKKNLIGIPWQVAFALQADGWLLRSDIIWHKPNAMPESVQDRPTSAHEYIFLLAKKRRYFYDSEAVKEPAVQGHKNSHFDRGKTVARHWRKPSPKPRSDKGTRNRRNVWTVSTARFEGAHFATFPEELIEPCIKAATSEKGCCPHCRSPWTRITARPKAPKVADSDLDRFGNGDAGVHRKIGSQYQEWLDKNPKQTVAWKPSCDCPSMHRSRPSFSILSAVPGPRLSW